MRKSITLAALGLAALLAGGYMAAQDGQPAAAGGKKAGKGKGQSDEDGIRAQARAFAKAFDKGDAKALAAFWTEDGELHDASGALFRGRGAIEKALAEFFKDNPKAKVEVLIESVRFLAKDLAIEEGILRQSGLDKELPATSLYSVVHLREGGQWKMAVSREWGAGQDRLEDLEWLVGRWQAAAGGHEMSLNFTWDRKKPFIQGRFVRKDKDKVVQAGTMKVGIDPQRGQLRSWHFDDDGGHGQALWLRDGNRWVLDSIGVLGDGAEIASLNILGRINGDEITWRSIDRVMGDEALPDTAPIKLRRVID